MAFSVLKVYPNAFKVFRIFETRRKNAGGYWIALFIERKGDSSFLAVASAVDGRLLLPYWSLAADYARRR